MKRRHAILAGLVAAVMTSMGVLAAAARTAPDQQPYGRPIGPAMAPDTGAGELLVAVVGGVFPSRQEAEDANEQLSFGDLQGTTWSRSRSSCRLARELRGPLSGGWKTSSIMVGVLRTSW